MSNVENDVSFYVSRAIPVSTFVIRHSDFIDYAILAAKPVVSVGRIINGKQTKSQEP
jgi:hypothetical protein